MRLFASTTQDLRHAVRILAHHPRHAVVVVLTLGIGLGGAFSLFDLVNLLAWRRPPVHRPQEVVAVYTGSRQPFLGPYGSTSYGDYLDYRQAVTTLDDLAAAAQLQVSLDSGEQISGWTVSGSYFEVLGVGTAVGRALRPSDDVRGAPPVAVLGWRLWHRLFAADPGIVGRTLRLDGRWFTIVGVAPEGFEGTTQTDLAKEVWLPLAWGLELSSSQFDWRRDRDQRRFDVLGRLRPGTDLAAAQSELEIVARRLDREHPLTGMERHLTVESLRFAHPVDRRGAAPLVRLLLAATALLLVVACANGAHLLLARAVSRRHEMGIRRALGAARARIVRQVLTESFLVAVAAGGVGLVLAKGARGLLAVHFGEAFTGGLRFDLRVLGLGLLTCVGVTLFCGLAPAILDARGDAIEAIKGGRRGGGGPREGRLGRCLAVAQVALVTVLLVASGLLARSLWDLQRADPGFDPQGLLFARVGADPKRYSREEGKAFFRQLVERTTALPGVERVGLALLAPPILLDAAYTFELPDSPGVARSSRFNYVDGGYFDALGLRVLAGRIFDRRDDADRPPVVVVNDVLAETLWPGQDPIGRRLRAEERRDGEPGPDYEVIGVVSSISQHYAHRTAEAILYFSAFQRYRSSFEVVARVSGGAAPIVDAFRAEVQRLDAEVAPFIRTFEEHRRSNLVVPRLQTQAVTLFAILGWSLAVVGVAGVMSYSVSRQVREIGLRMALGARREEVQCWVVQRGMKLTTIGLVLGIATSFAATRLLHHYLFGVEAWSATILLMVAIAVLVSAGLAVSLPARRAARIDPLEALRQE